MASSGILIAVEGIDGSGKRTQVKLLAKALAAQGRAVFPTSFPHYDSWFGKMVGQFLNGDFGPLESVDPHFTALLYAGDRFEAKPLLEGALHKGFVVLADRYIGSNLAHQTARAPRAQRDAFIAWIEHLEYHIYNLPREALVLYLRVRPHAAQDLVDRKSARSYTKAKKDLLEASLKHLETASSIYDQLSRRPNWTTIQCYDEQRSAMRSPKSISQDILAAVQAVLQPSSPAAPAASAAAKETA
jgi:dTMP kinase